MIKLFLLLFMLIPSAWAQYFEQVNTVFKVCLSDPYGAECSNERAAVLRALKDSDRVKLKDKIELALKEIMPEELSELFYNHVWVKQASAEKLEWANKQSLRKQISLDFRYGNEFMAERFSRIQALTTCFMKHKLKKNFVLEVTYHRCRASELLGFDIDEKDSKKFSSWARAMRETAIYYGMHELDTDRAGSFDRPYLGDARKFFEKAALRVPERFKKKRLFSAPGVDWNSVKAVKTLSEENLTKEAIWLMGHFKFMLKAYPEYVVESNSISKSLKAAFLSWNPKKEYSPRISVEQYFGMVHYYYAIYLRLKDFDDSGKYLFSMAREVCNFEDNWRYNRTELKECFVKSLNEIRLRAIAIKGLLALDNLITERPGLIPYIDY